MSKLFAYVSADRVKTIQGNIENSHDKNCQARYRVSTSIRNKPNKQLNEVIRNFKVKHWKDFSRLFQTLLAEVQFQQEYMSKPGQFPSCIPNINLGHLSILFLSLWKTTQSSLKFH